MTLKFDYMEHNLEFLDSYVQSLEIENKGAFYQTVNSLILLNQGVDVETIHFYDKDYQELEMNSKLKIVIDYFNLNFDEKKCITEVTKKLDVSDAEKKSINKKIKELSNIVLKMYDIYDLPFEINSEFSINDLIKYLKLTVKKENSILNNLLLLIDMNKIISNHSVIILVNVKQYLEKEELLELYKYSVYNKIKLLLIDSQSYGVTLDYEHKLIVEKDLNEIII